MYDNSSINAGSYSATLTTDSNHVFTSGDTVATVNWSIAKTPYTLKPGKAARNVKLAKVKKAKQTMAGAKVADKGQGALTYSVKKVTKAKYKKYVSINKRNGKITLKKGTPKGSFKVTVKAVAAGNSNYAKSTAKTAVVTVKVS